MFFKKYLEKTNEQKKDYLSKKSHNQALELANTWIDEKNTEESEELLDYLINSLLSDVCSSSIVHPIITFPSELIHSPFPESYIDYYGNRNDISSEETIDVELDKAMVYVRPWNTERTRSSLMLLKSSNFKYIKENHFSIFYKDINLCFVYNGNHSINAGRYYKKGTITSKVYHLEKLYPHCYTDGVYWYNSHSKEILHRVDDFRLATVYSIAQLKYNKFIKQQ